MSSASATYTPSTPPPGATGSSVRSRASSPGEPAQVDRIAPAAPSASATPSPPGQLTGVPSRGGASDATFGPDPHKGVRGARAAPAAAPDGVGGVMQPSTTHGAAPPRGGQPIVPTAPDPALTSSSPVHGVLMGRKFTSEFPFQGRKVPLPPGEWTVLAALKASNSPQTQEAVALAKTTGSRLDGLVSIFGQRLLPENATGWRRHSACDRKDAYFLEAAANEEFGRQDCLVVNHIESRYLSASDSPAWMRGAVGQLTVQQVAIPHTLLLVGFRAASKEQFLNLIYYFNPASEGLVTTPAQWNESDWHKNYIGRFPDKKEYAERLKTWGVGVWARVSPGLGDTGAQSSRSR